MTEKQDETCEINHNKSQLITICENCGLSRQSHKDVPVGYRGSAFKGCKKFKAKTSLDKKSKAVSHSSSPKNHSPQNKTLYKTSGEPDVFNRSLSSDKGTKTEGTFNLSEKIIYLSAVTPPKPYQLFVDDVKEFIRRLKERFKKGEENIPINVVSVCLDYSKIIDNLAGKNLSGDL